MPHLKVNVNGKKYTISGLSRNTCSSQILCALAKVDAELQVSLARNGATNNGATDSRRENQTTKPKLVRESKRKLRIEERGKSGAESESKSTEERKGAGRKKRSTRKTQESDKKGIQTSNGKRETTLTETQQCCLQPQQESSSLKEKVLEDCLQKVDEDLNEGWVIHDGIEKKNPEQAKDTDHDTGISELHSDSSFEHNQTLSISVKADIEQCLKGIRSKSSPTTINTASTNNEPIESAGIPNARMRDEVEDFIVAQLVGSETDDECSCFAVGTVTEEFYDEIEKVRGDLLLTEAKLAEQNKMIEVLTSLMDADGREMAGNQGDDDVTYDVDERVRELTQSIKLSKNLYEYQTMEMQANALELERVESRITRKRWHVESLLQELHSARSTSGQSNHVHYKAQGTLV